MDGWYTFIQTLIQKGGIFGIAVVVEAIVIYNLYKKLITSHEHNTSHLKEQNNYCKDCLNKQADAIKISEAESRRQLAEFYTTARNDLRTYHEEIAALEERVIAANEKVVSGLSTISSTLSHISGRLG